MGMIQFIQLNSSSYKNLVEHDPESLYFLIDTHEICLGNTKYARNQVVSVSEVPDPQSADADTIYLVPDGAGNTVIYTKSASGIEPISGASGVVFVESEAEMLALQNILPGQIVYREDTDSIYILKGGPASIISNWQEFPSGQVFWDGTTDGVTFYAIADDDYDLMPSHDANTLYFTQGGKIYKGDVDYTSFVIAVNQLPDISAAIPNRLYVVSGDGIDTPQFQMAIKQSADTDTWTYIFPGYLTDGSNWTANGGSLATANVINTMIQNSLNTFVYSPIWDSVGRTLTLPVKGGESVVVNIPQNEAITSGGYYDNWVCPVDSSWTEENVIVLVIGDGSAREDYIVIPAGSLIQTLTPINDGHTVQITIQNGEIYADVKLDTNTSGTGTVVAVNSNGTIVNTGYQLGGATLAAQPSDTKLATEAAVYNAMCWKYIGDDPSVSDVTSETALVDAVDNAEVSTIDISNAIAINQPFQIDKEITINGNNNTITTSVAGKVFTITQNADINDIVINSTADNTEWHSSYGIQLYTGTHNINNAKLSGGNAGLIVNGATVTLSGIIDVSDNTFGGIEVSKGAAPGLTAGVLNINGATLVNTTEAYGKPTIWIDGTTEDIGIVNGAENLTQAIIKNQIQYYINPENAVDPTTI